MKINTTPGETYIVLSTGGCTVTTGAGKQIKKLAAGQDFFTAMTGDSIISDDNASVAVAKGEILAMLNTDGTGAEVQATLRFQPVTSQSALPATGENGVIYLVPNGADAPNQYTEWVWTGAAYEQLGDVSVDLSGYASKKDLGITNIADEDSGQMIFADSYLITKHVGVSTLEVGGCTFSGSTGGSNVVTTTGSLSAGTLAGHDVVTTGGAIITNYIKVVSEMPTLEHAGMTMGAAIRGASFTDANWGTRHAIEINADRVSLTNMSGPDPYLEVRELRTTRIVSLAGDGGEFMVGNYMRVGRDFVSFGGDLYDDKSIRIYANDSGITTLHIGSQAEIIGLGNTDTQDNISARAVTTDTLYTNVIHVNDTNELIAIYANVTGIQSLGVGGRIDAACFATNNGYIRIGSMEGGTAVPELYLGEGVQITGPGWDTMVQQIQAGSSGGTGSGSGSTGDSNQMDTLYVSTIYPADTTDLITIEAYVTGVHSLGVKDDIYVGNQITTKACYTRELGVKDFIEIDYNTIRIGKSPSGSDGLYLGTGKRISGPGWEEMQAAAAATAAESERESFTKLIFPPTGTATAEQDPSWITKKNILMETNGGQLNMTQLTATLSYAAQNRFDIAKRTLWLSTSPGTGDAVQWPANAVFPDDQAQDKIQQLNSNSTYWFDITYVGGSDTVLIRKVCSWASTTGENGPTD